MEEEELSENVEVGKRLKDEQKMKVEQKVRENVFSSDSSFWNS